MNSEAFNVSVNPAVDNVSHSSNFFLSFFFPYLLNFLLYELIGPLDHLFKKNTIIFPYKVYETQANRLQNTQEQQNTTIIKNQKHKQNKIFSKVLEAI